MPKARQPGGIISSNYDGLKVPDAPTLDSATAGNEEVEVAFTAPADEGGSAITGYGAVAVDGSGNSISNTGSSSPITVTGLTNGTSYTAKVWAINAFGPSGYSGASGSVTPEQLQRGLFAGGSVSGGDYTNVIEYVTITTTGNATDFGDLIAAQGSFAGCASLTRGIFAGGFGASGNVIQYVTIASAGNATDFGDLYDSGTDRSGLAGCNSSTRGLFAGGTPQVGNVNTIQRITIATTGNASNFGDLTTANQKNLASCSSSTRGLWAGGYDGDYWDTICYSTIATTGNATDFGDLTVSVGYLSGCSSSTRGLFGGGRQSGSVGFVDVIGYVTIASTGNATDFGNLAAATGWVSAASGLTRGLFGGGWTYPGSSVYLNTIQYVTISSTGNTTDFGDLSQELHNLSACSSANGGVQ